MEKTGKKVRNVIGHPKSLLRHKQTMRSGTCFNLFLSLTRYKIDDIASLIDYKVNLMMIDKLKEQ